MIARNENHIDQILNSVYRPDKLSHDKKKIDPIIQRSWERCVTNYNLEPSHTRSAKILTHEELKDFKLPVEEFLHVAKSGLYQLYDQVKALNYVVLLTDYHGVTVDYIGNDTFDKDYKAAGLYLGADWNEKHAGTCAVGVCATEMEPVTVHLTEHFDVKNTTLTCSAVPIFDPDGSPLAVLDVSALQSPSNKESQYLLLQLVKLHAQAIEGANFLHNFQDRHHIVRFSHLRDYVNVNATHMLAIDESGKIIGANTSARKFLTSCSSWRETDWNSLINKNINDYFNIHFSDLISRNAIERKAVHAARMHRNTDLLFLSVTSPLRKASPTPKQEMQPSLAASNSLDLDSLTSSDPSLSRSISIAKQLVNHKVNFLIQGETGSGKEIFARAIHQSSQRADKPFIAVNCAAIPESLIESELFGYKPGTFTGARQKGMKGLIQQSSGGTLFLDEIGDMPVHLQTRLLRVLSEQEVMPLGSDESVPVDLNVIAASHKHIEKLIEEDGFREDLYFRLAGATISLPALRERKDQAEVVHRVIAMEAIDRDVSISEEAVNLLTSYHWPGNFRELRNVLRVALAFCPDELIQPHHLPDEFHAKLRKALMQPASSPALEQAELHETVPLNSDAQHLLNALKTNKWNITDTSDELGISRNTIYRKMKKYKIIPPNEM